jgi:hypothetical protein
LSSEKIPIKFPEVNIPDRPVRSAVEQLITEINSKMGGSSERWIDKFICEDTDHGSMRHSNPTLIERVFRQI